MDVSKECRDVIYYSSLVMDCVLSFKASSFDFLKSCLTKVAQKRPAAMLATNMVHMMMDRTFFMNELTSLSCEELRMRLAAPICTVHNN